MRFPYSELAPGYYRPLVALGITGPSKTILKDGLLDTGADRTILPLRLADELGIDMDGLTEEAVVRSASGELLHCKVMRLPLQLLQGGKRVAWEAEVAIPRFRSGSPTGASKASSNSSAHVSTARIASSP